MSCNCIEEIDRDLKERQGGKMSVSLFIAKNEIVARPTIEILRCDTGRAERRSGKAKVVTPTFCPFCGTAYAGDPA